MSPETLKMKMAFFVWERNSMSPRIERDFFFPARVNKEQEFRTVQKQIPHGFRYWGQANWAKSKLVYELGAVTIFKMKNLRPHIFWVDIPGRVPHWVFFELALENTILSTCGWDFRKRWPTGSPSFELKKFVGQLTIWGPHNK